MNSSIAIKQPNKIHRGIEITVVEFIHFGVHAETCPIEISGPSVSLLYNWTPDKNITSQDLMVSCHGMAFGSMLFKYLEYSSIWNSIFVLFLDLLDRSNRASRGFHESKLIIFLSFVSFHLVSRKCYHFFGWASLNM